MAQAHWYHWEDGDLIVRIRVQPRASRDRFAGVLGDRLKLCITAPPVDGAANAHLLEFLADAFGVARRDVVLVHGERGKSKTLRIRQPQRIPPDTRIDTGNGATPLR